ncbi:hypothetical protein M430DRAFT_135842 [Amorphotheca resinae ATCC 22711]|uniref:Xylanolytic transcriptional activator regulatory domain-containing protein n=1 Tax=Amorphotheca resinae ATCC 22711 TaxID=857342 RepID=A0A2T3B8K0_AMORE|nr:hypothetical protein M430DRAFT_135842 [Amorphotheca resinae ATCC 22711]PSS23173.1 hypothetical protein M430DRAFT_135842 [Amorphotheca resinae ATCC 22711]
MRGIDKVPSSKASTDRVTSSALIPGSKEELYIKAYFEHVHPIYPFLDQEAFQTRASSLQHSQVPTDKAWPALYHAVLALGCQYHDGGSFEPWRGEAWRYFEVSLSLAPDLLIIKPSLMTVQAFTAMAVFSLTISCMQIEATMVSEGAKMAQALRLNKVKDDITSARTFWVLYWMEKTSCFYGGRGSVLMDSDVGCPIPHLPETILDGFNWFLAFCRYARLLSKMYEFLFTVNANVNTPALYWITIDHLKEELERWRLSIPPPFRPGDAFRTRELSGSMAMSIALRLHFSYHNALLAFSRVTFHVGADEPPSSERMRESKTCMIKSARCILELTKFIDVEAYTPLWILAIMPISALFILFELVVHNPNHPETDSNLALLDVASGHFSRLEYESNGSLPGSLIAEFAHLARQHVRDVQEQQRESSTRRRVSTTELSNQEMTLPIIQQGAYLPGTMTEHDPQQGLLPVESDTLFFPIFDEPRYPNQTLPSGIDIMDLFDSTMPVFPFFSNGE